MNRQWNEISSAIMRQRADIKLQFAFIDGEFMQVFEYRRCEELLVDCCKTFTKIGSKNLNDFVECLAEASHFPFTGFQFDNLSKFRNGDVRSFLENWGMNIVALSINIDPLKTDIGILRELLFDRVCNLKKLEIGFRRRSFRRRNWLSREDIPISTQSSADSSQFHLDQLEVVRVQKCHWQYHSNSYAIIKGILTAAPRLKTFENQEFILENGFPLDGLRLDGPILELMRKLNKLDCLKQVRIDEKLTDHLVESPYNVMSLELKSLSLLLNSRIFEDEKWKARSIVNDIFRSSRDVMQTLRIENLELLAGLEIPKLKRLRKLYIQYDYVGTMFPPTFDLAGTFPNLKELGKLKL